MSKGKLQKFADLEHYPNVFQYPFHIINKEAFPLKGRWNEGYFHNSGSIILELGCGKGEYTTGLARLFPDANYIGVDIKGARLWTGATQALSENLANVAFLRTEIEFIDSFFSAGEVSEIWLTFCDPQMKNPRKRLTSTCFMERYRRFLTDNGAINLKTDSNFLFTYTRLMAEKNGFPVDVCTDNLYADAPSLSGSDENAMGKLLIRTFYEAQWIERGMSIKYIKFRLPHEGTLAEPDAEIPVDSYRSFNRGKRSGKSTAR